MRIIKEPTEIKAAGMPVKLIKEFVGKINSSTDEISIARMKSPEGWSEPGQKPEFTEYTFVLSGTLVIDTKDGKYEASANEVVVAEKDEWVKYSSPYKNGAEYIAICLPAFTPEKAKRDQE